jgi:hypothetical protein
MDIDDRVDMDPHRRLIMVSCCHRDGPRHSAPSRAGPDGSGPCSPTPRRGRASRRRGLWSRRHGCGGTARASWPGPGRDACHRRRRSAHRRPAGTPTAARRPPGFRSAAWARPRPAYLVTIVHPQWEQPGRRGARAGDAPVTRGPPRLATSPAVIDEDGEPVQLREQELRIVRCVPAPAPAAFTLRRVGPGRSHGTRGCKPPTRVARAAVRDPTVLQEEAWQDSGTWKAQGPVAPHRHSWAGWRGAGALTVRGAPPCGSRTGWRTCHSAVD